MKDRSNRWPEYHPQTIESKWQVHWEQSDLYLATEGAAKPKYYCLDFFPYPSGDGLHVGHCRNYVPTDVVSRYKRMKGFNVLHPMGWDAFGEPAEQYAVSHGVHPRITTDRNTANFRKQMTIIGASYDWSRELDSSDPEFYRWTQYFFLLLYQRGLAYRDTNWQWWCPVCQTTLSSHEVAGGVCWRGHTGVTRREIPAWYFRITAYADELLFGLDDIDWPEPIKRMQRNWIGRSEGCEIIFQTTTGDPVPVFTTRPDTIFGVTFLAMAPEHPLLSQLTTLDRSDQVQDYLSHVARQSETERMSDAHVKTGVFTGGYLINPLSGEQIPVWVADYVLPGYGSEAIMGVPAHDQRDFEFARSYELPIKQVIACPGYQGDSLQSAYTGPGVMINSGQFEGYDNDVGAQKICDQLTLLGIGGPKVSYRMHDWLISRQRYWGTPIPIIYCEACGEIPVPENQLPVLLPPMSDFQPDGSGRSPLARMSEFVNTSCPKCGGQAKRETDTMGGFACSSWYFMRFTSPHYDQAPFDPSALYYWMPVDLYVGGAEHAVLHLLYSRFWTRVISDTGLISFREPFRKLLNQGQLLGVDGFRMSKSRGNVITPDNVVSTHGADALRIYVMFMAPFDQDIAWSTEGINGASRFLKRIWDLFSKSYFESQAVKGEDPVLLREMHQTIRNVSERIEGFRFNTMVSALMEFSNFLGECYRSGRWRTATYHQALEVLLVLIAPAAPHIAEELWLLTGHTGSVHNQPWPAWDTVAVEEEIWHIAVQIDGRLRDVIQVPAEADESQILELAMENPKVRLSLAGRQIAKIVYVAGKILSIVTADG